GIAHCVRDTHARVSLNSRSDIIFPDDFLSLDQAVFVIQKMRLFGRYASQEPGAGTHYRGMKT
ncbi:MAG: hypothetical protein RKP73_06400, partial [Candidatus Contendobacter sp.]|nr:hypothetical protein [Candidatus Contendobacter sp.]